MLSKNWTIRRSHTDQADREGWKATRASVPVARRPGMPLRQTMLPITAVGIAFLLAGIGGAWQVHRLHQQGSDMLANDVAVIRAVEELQAMIQEIRHRLKRFDSTQSPRQLEEIQSLIRQGQSWKQQALHPEAAGSKQLGKQVSDQLEAFDNRVNWIQHEKDPELRRRSIDHLTDEVIPNQILSTIQRYIQWKEEQLAQRSERNRTSANQLMFGLLVLGTCGGVTGLFAGYTIARRVNRTIVQLSLPIQDAAGTLDRVAGPLSIGPLAIHTQLCPLKPTFEDLESMLKSVFARVTTVVERLQENEREMLRSEQFAAMGQLAAGLAHELRNPLTSLKAILQLAETPAELTERDLEVLKQEMARLEDSVQAFLDFARPPQPNKRPTDLSLLVGDTIDLLARRAQRKRVQVFFNRSGVNPLLLVDASQVRQVVLNLMINALDAVAVGGTIHITHAVEPAMLSIDSRQSSTSLAANLPQEARAWQLLTFADDGRGLPEAMGNRIFEPFTSTKESGIGLGLSICKRIVEAHGGCIAARNGLTTGAVFEIRLPVSEQQIDSPEDDYGEVANC